MIFRNKFTKLSIITIVLALFASNMVLSAKAEGEIQVFDGQISSSRILRGDTFHIHATIVNLGNLTIIVQSLNAFFKNSDNIKRFDVLYTERPDYDHRSLDPGQSLTVTLMDTIRNAEGDYNLTIYFVATDPYSSDEPPGVEPIDAPALNFTITDTYSVSVYNRSSASGVVAGIGYTFLGAVGLVALYLLYNWFKERRLKKKYE